jgi:plastocyanin
MIRYPLGILFWLLACGSALAANFSLQLMDSKGQPLEYAVAALVPENNIHHDPTQPGIMDQRENTFVPYVLAVPVNTLVHFPNSDDVRHHVYSFSPAKRFELRLYHGQTAEPVLFDQPGKVVLGCNIHDSMLAYIYVLETNYFAISDAKGQLQITDMPAGTYRLDIYHPWLVEPLVLNERLAIDSDEQLQLEHKLESLLPPASTEEPGKLKKLFKRY